LIELALLAILLAPTDAALGKAVVSNPKVAAPVREGLNVESGLNDGICVPVLLMFLALLIEEHTQSPLSLAIELFFEELGIGALIGGTLTFMAWLMQRYSGKHHWQTPMWSQLTLPGLAVLCFATAQTLGGSGFIAAFVGGLLASYLFAEQKHNLLKASEEFASLLSIITWVVFGALVIPSVWSSFTVDVWLYALLSLTVIRIVPVLVSLAGTGFDFETRLFIGWFGPRGLASIVFAIMILDYPLQTGRTLVAVAACTVLLSVLLHGLSANPWVSRLANRIN
jgi:NhaP-type Na+/H+ or K+/H+ antiporter